MSKKRMLNIVELSIQIVMFLSMIIFKSCTLTGGASSNYATLNTTIHVGFLGYVAMIGAKSIIVVVLALASNTLICAISIFGNHTDKDGKLHIALPIIQLVILFGYLSLFSGPSGWDITRNGAYVTFVYLCLFAVLVLAIVKRSTLIVPKEETNPTIIQKSSNADELKKYKDLLDGGVITQEEFDQKKKQLLGL